MAASVPEAPNAPLLGIPTTGAAAETKALFGVLLDRGQDFINRTIAALNDLKTLPSSIIPAALDTSWVDPTFTRPIPLAGARPEAPSIPGAAAAQIIFDWLSDPDPAVRRAYEAATFARAADRAVAEGMRLSDEAASRWSAAGFSLPPGMLNAQLDRVQQEVANATLQASFEAMTRAQDMQIQKYTLCIQQALGAITDIYKAEASIYIGDRNADAEALKAEADVFGAKVQALVQRVTMELRGSEIENNVMIANLQLIEKAMGEIAQTYAQLAAGATSALHASTGFEDRAQYTNSQGMDWRVDWSFRADY